MDVMSFLTKIRDKLKKKKKLSTKLEILPFSRNLNGNAIWPFEYI